MRFTRESIFVVHSAFLYRCWLFTKVKLAFDLNLIALNHHFIGPDVESDIGLASPSFCIIGVAVNWTNYHSISKPTSAEWPKRMGTSIIERIKIFIVVENSDSPSIDGECFSTSTSNI